MIGCAYSARPICFFEDPALVEARVDPLQRRAGTRPRARSSRIRPLRVVGQDVVREVDDVPAAVRLLRDEVRVLDDAAEGHRRRRPRSSSSRARATGRARGSGRGRGSTRSRSTPARVSSGRSGASLSSSGIATVERTRSNVSVPPANVDVEAAGGASSRSSPAATSARRRRAPSRAGARASTPRPNEPFM